MTLTSALAITLSENKLTCNHQFLNISFCPAPPLQQTATTTVPPPPPPPPPPQGSNETQELLSKLSSIYLPTK
uniref:Uncharacterized protein n=1 Tax=Onchocerca volvulus TaxID=6282 RepID=A0A8R1TNS6_ONCVO